ncbi:MAG: tetratricopeptide repeat protein [Candidatus Nitrosotenuis sp.]
MSVKSLFIVLLIAFSTIPSFADEAWVVVATDKPQYLPSETMEIFGYVLERKMPVIAMSIYDPDGVILSANNIELQEDDSFTKTISLDSPFYDKSGIYLIELDYGKNTDSLTFEVIGGTPETQTQPLPQIKPEVIFLETDEDVYSDNEFITISGIVSKIGEPTILIGIYDQNNFPTGFYTPQISSDLEFSVSFLAKDGVNFKTAGKYYAKAHYGESKQEVEFEFSGSSQIPSRENSRSLTRPQIVQTQSSIPQDNPKTQLMPQTSEAQQKTPVRVIDSNNFQVISSDNDSSGENKADNLSVEDQELGKLLNEIMLKCDSSKYSDIILYYDGMGPALMRLCNYEQAISYFDNSLIKDPNNIEALTNKATAYAKLGDLDVAIEYYDMVLEINPDFVPALNNKANALAQLGHFDEAISIYESIQNQDHHVQANLQKAKESLVQSNKNQHESHEVVSPVVIMPTKIEAPDAGHEPPKSGNFIEQIGSIFATFFGFLS